MDGRRWSDPPILPFVMLVCSATPLLPRFPREGVLPQKRGTAKNCDLADETRAARNNGFLRSGEAPDEASRRCWDYGSLKACAPTRSARLRVIRRTIRTRRRMRVSFLVASHPVGLQGQRDFSEPMRMTGRRLRRKFGLPEWTPARGLPTSWRAFRAPFRRLFSRVHSGDGIP
jgi:hypothetical protein